MSRPIFNSHIHMHFLYISCRCSLLFVYCWHPTIQCPELKLSYTKMKNVVRTLDRRQEKFFVYDNLWSGHWIIGRNKKLTLGYKSENIRKIRQIVDLNVYTNALNLLECRWKNRQIAMVYRKNCKHQPTEVDQI